MEKGYFADIAYSFALCDFFWGLLSVDTEESHLTGIEEEITILSIGRRGMNGKLLFTVHDKLGNTALVFVKIEEVRGIVFLDESCKTEILVAFFIFKEADERVFKGLQLNEVVGVVVEYGIYAVVFTYVVS
jgi:hypothetical protein